MTDFFEQHASERDKWEAEMERRAEEEQKQKSFPNLEENPFEQQQKETQK